MLISDTQLEGGSSLAAFHPSKGNLLISHYQENEFYAVSLKVLGQYSIKEILADTFAFRFTLPNHTSVYFVSQEIVFSRLTGSGKSTRWLFELFEYWRQDLILKGFHPDTSIYHWPLKDLMILLTALIVFPGSKMEAMQ